MEQDTAKSKEEDLQNQIVRLNEKIVKLNADSGVSIEELEKRLKILQKKKDKVNTDKDSIQNRITQREELQITLEEILDKFDEEDLEEGIGTLKQLKGNVSTIEGEVEKVNIKLESLYERKEHLDSHKYNEDCNICMENSKSILETKEKVESEIKEKEAELQSFEKEKLDLTIHIDSLKTLEEEWKNFNEAKEKEDKIDREISQLINKLSTIETEEFKNSTQIAQQEQLIEEY